MKECFLYIKKACRCPTAGFNLEGAPTYLPLPDFDLLYDRFVDGEAT